MTSPVSTSRRIAIVGPGAIGGHFAARLALAGHEVSLLASPSTARVLQARGLRYRSGQGPEEVLNLPASDRAEALGEQDLVIVALKSQMLPRVAPTLVPLLGGHTVVMPVGNGLPWWFFAPSGQPCHGMRLRSVDPQGLTEAAIPLGQVLGGSIMASCHSPQSGVVVHSAGGRVTMGEPLGGTSERGVYWCDVLARAGLNSTLSGNIRADLWNKLLGNVCSNPLSLLTGASTDVMLADPEMCALYEKMTDECIQLGRALGLPIATTAAQRIEQTRQLGAIKTSMLQDLEAGRPVELDAIVSAPIECAEALGFPVPMLRAVKALAVQRARQAGVWHL